MHESVVRVLIVDDFTEWRQVIRGIVSGMPQAEIAGEAADGLEAVEKAQQLQPDLILLDIGIPGLNGIEAARQIAKVCPQSKIAFLTENRCYELVEEALQVGARGYILKSHFDSEVIPGVAAIVKGKQFVSHAMVRAPR
jgi:DNA-binding NarL/FixJ family response regulator